MGIGLQWEDSIYRTGLFGEFLAQPGKDLAARFLGVLTREALPNGPFEPDEQGRTKCYRLIDLGCGVGFRECYLDLPPCEPNAPSRTTRGHVGDDCIRAEAAFSADAHWPTRSDDLFLARQDQGAYVGPWYNTGLGWRRGDLLCPKLLIDPSEEGAGWKAWEECDVLMATSSLQWCPDQALAIENLMTTVRSGGYLCAAVPRFGGDALFRKISFAGLDWDEQQISSSSVVVNPAPGEPQHLHALSVGEYTAVLSAYSDEHWVWDTTYYQQIHGTHDIEEWYAHSGMGELVDAIADGLYSEASSALLKEELFKWLRAGNPTPVGEDLLLSYPFTFFIARNG